MNNLLKRIARLLPDDVLFGQSWIYAKKIHRAYKKSQDKVDFILSYQNEKLKQIFTLARKATFYDYLNDLPVEINKVPFIDKECVLRNKEQMIIQKSGADYVTTGGTTGKPLGFYINKNRKGFEWYWMTNNWSKVGFNLKTYRAVLRNHKFKNERFKIDPLLREIQYNNFSLSERYIDYIISHCLENKIEFLHAYPSAAYMIADRIRKTNINHSFSTFLCGSEVVLPYQKEVIQDELKIRMYSFYGHTEKLIMAGEEAFCENYHSNPFYGITEIVDPYGNLINKSGETGELVGTGFINTKMPFVRFKTGDLCEYVGPVCPNCGTIGLIFKNVQGRKGDKIFKSDGSAITTTALNLHGEIYNYIREMQYYQEKMGVLEVRVVSQKRFDESVKNKLYEELSSKVGDHLTLQIKEVKNLEYSINNKFQLLIQKIRN